MPTYLKKLSLSILSMVMSEVQDVMAEGSMSQHVDAAMLHPPSQITAPSRNAIAFAILMRTLQTNCMNDHCKINPSS